MKSLVLMRPFKAVGATMFQGATPAGNATVGRVNTPDPKEVFYSSNGGAFGITIDLGQVQTVDGLFVGYNWFGNAGDTVSATCTPDNQVQTGAWNGQAFAARTEALDYTGWFSRLAAPVQARYVNLSFNTPSAPTIGIISVGRCFSAQWGTEYGAGRSIGDTGSADRLFGGGFGIDEGTTFGGYGWTFGDLQPAEVDALYALVKRIGLSRSCLVVEDPDLTDGLNNRFHWGLLRKLDAYERLDPTNTKWSLQIEDWA